MGGKGNPWKDSEGDKYTALREREGQKMRVQGQQTQSYNDGMIELSAAETFFDLPFHTTNRIG
jgi:hypothetical protein